MEGCHCGVSSRGERGIHEQLEMPGGISAWGQLGAPSPASHCSPLGRLPGPRTRGRERPRPQDSMSPFRAQLLGTEMPSPPTRHRAGLPALSSAGLCLPGSQSRDLRGSVLIRVRKSCPDAAAAFVLIQGALVGLELVGVGNSNGDGGWRGWGIQGWGERGAASWAGQDWGQTGHLAACLQAQERGVG